MPWDQDLQRQVPPRGKRCQAKNEDGTQCWFHHANIWTNNIWTCRTHRNQLLKNKKEKTIKNIPMQEKLDALNMVGQNIHTAICFNDGLLTCQLQVGNPSEKEAVSGCFPTHLIDFVIELHQHYMDTIPCRDTEMVITKLEEARLWLEKRKIDREKRGVLQTDKN